MLIFGRKAKIIELAIITVASLTIQELFFIPRVDTEGIEKITDDKDEISSGEDSDLITQIDINRKINQMNNKREEIKEKQKEIKKEQLKMRFMVKEKWFSERGDIHTNVLAIGTYLQYMGQLKQKLDQKQIERKEFYDS